MRILTTLLFLILSLFGQSQNSTVNVNGQLLRYFVDYDSTLPGTKSWARAADGVDRFRTNSAYPYATHLYNATNAVTGNIINTQGVTIQHLHDMGITGKGIKIGMIDLQFSEYPGLTFAGGIGSYLIPTPSGTITEHGTTMSSIIGEKPNGYMGLVKPNGIVGIAYEAQLYAFPLTTGVAEVQACIDSGMDIINMPLNLGYSLALKNKIQEAIQRGIYVCAASGNSNVLWTPSPIVFPAATRGVFAITARAGGLVFAEDSIRTYSSVLPSSVTGESKALDFAVPAWAVGKDNAYGRGWTAHVGTSEAVSIMSGYIALMLDYHKSLYGIKLRPFQALNWLSKHTINPFWGGKYFQDMSFLNPGQENSAPPIYEPLPPIVAGDSVIASGIVYDFERISGTTSSASGVGGQLTMSRAAVEGDIGKVVVVKEAKRNLSYREAPFSWNGKVVSVSAGVATITSPRGDTLINVSDKEVLIGTNNFDTLQYYLDYCLANNKPRLILGSGTAYIVPELSTKCPLQAHSSVGYRGLRIKNNLTIKGVDSNTTILKFGVEDIMKPGDASTEFNYAAFVWGSVVPEISNLKIQAPDRLTTRTNSLVSCLRSDYIANGHKSFTLRNASISGHRDNGWVAGFECSVGGDIGFTVVNSFINSSITARNPINMFNQNNYKNCIIDNLVTVGGGSKAYRPPYSNAANMTSGSNVLTVSNNPEFSFYDFNSYDAILGSYRIGGSTYNQFLLSSITSPTVALMATNSPVTYTNAELFGIGRVITGNTFGAEGHTAYIHPNVGLFIKKWTVKDSYRMSLEYFSSNPEVFADIPVDAPLYIDSFIVEPTIYDAGFISSNALTFSSAMNLTPPKLSGRAVTIKNSSFRFYANFGLNVDISNCTVGSGQFGGGTVFKSTGTFDSRSNTDLYMDSIEGSPISISYTDSSVRNRKSIVNSGNVSRLGQVNIISCDDTLVIRNSKMSDLYFYKACINTNSRYTFENIDIRGGFGWSFFYANPQAAWTTEEKNQFIAQSTFTNCSCSAGVYAGMDPLIKPFFTVN